MENNSKKPPRTPSNVKIDISRLEMMRTYLVSLMDDENSKKLMDCSPEVIVPIYNGTTRMSPASIFINSGSDEDIAYIRQKSLEIGEEFPLDTKNHTYVCKSRR